MPSARDHPFNQSRRPLLECRPGGQMNIHHDEEEAEDDDYADYEDIRNNNNKNTTATSAPSSDIRYDFKTYGFVSKFAKAPAIASSSHNEARSRNNNNNIFNGFHDFNAVPRANGEDVGYPYGEKIINEKQPIATDFMFSEQQQQQENNNRNLNNQTQSHYQSPGTLPRKLNNQHVNLYNNNFNQPKFEKIGNRMEPDFANRPLPQTPPTPSSQPSPLVARQRPAAAPRAVCPTPPLCRANRKGPFIFGVDNNISSNSSPAASPLLDQHQHQQRRAPVIEQWKYSEGCNVNRNNSPDLLPNPATIATEIRRREAFQRTQNSVQTNHDTIWDPKKGIWEDKRRAREQKNDQKTGKNQKCAKPQQVNQQKKRQRGHNKGAGDDVVKCVIVGDAAVGKTNLIISYLENRFVQEHIPTASDIYNGEVEVDGSPVHVTLCDTAGQNTTNASALRELCYPGSDVFLVCFSVVNPETFRSVQTNWIPTLTKQHRNATVILIGTQSDLRNDHSTVAYLQMQGEKPVSVTDAWDYARSIGAKYVETSSRTKEKVKDAFDTAIWDALVSQKQQSIKKPLWMRLLCLA